jgi:hypothetical protein
MLDQLTFTGSSTPVEPAHLAGKTIAHSCSWSPAKRARLAAKATFGAVMVTRLTAVQAAAVFGVPRRAVAKELKKLGVTLRHTTNGNGNGHAAAPAPTWETLTSEQKAEFLKTNFNEIWNELERVTA